MNPSGASFDFIVSSLQDHHDRAAFTCGVESLDTYLKTRADQDMRRLADGVFVLAETRLPSRIVGYCTLAATALEPGVVPEPVRDRLPRYPLVSATLIDRLAVAADRQGQGLGRILLGRALARAREAAATVGSCMVVVDALDEAAARFYAAHALVRLPNTLRLVLPMASIPPVTPPASGD